jgi:hypothetical protein
LSPESTFIGSPGFDTTTVNMEDHLDIPEESMRHIEALLSKHPPQMIQRMFAQAIDSRRLVLLAVCT